MNDHVRRVCSLRVRHAMGSRLVLLTALLASPVAGAAPELFFGEDLSPYSYPAPNQVPRLTNLVNTTAAATKFRARLPGVAAESFESYATGSQPTNVSFGANLATFSGQREIFTVVDPTNTFGGLFPFSGTNTLLLKAETPTFLTLSFSTPQAAFGFFGSDFGEPAGMKIVLIGPSSSTRELPVPITKPQGSGGSFFFGVIDSETPFVSIEFHQTDVVFDWFGLDDMTIATPEQVLPTPAVLHIAWPGFPRITVAGSSGATYRVESCTSLLLSDWAFRTNVTMPSALQTVDDDQAPHPKSRFYRAIGAW